MKINRRHAFMSLVAAAMLAGPASAADTIRVGLPTKTYWPTTIAETAVRQKLFEKEGIQAELTMRRRDLRRHGRGRCRHHPRSAVAGLRRPQEGRDVAHRRQCRDGQFRL